MLSDSVSFSCFLLMVVTRYTTTFTGITKQLPVKFVSSTQLKFAHKLTNYLRELE